MTHKPSSTEAEQALPPVLRLDSASGREAAAREVTCPVQVGLEPRTCLISPERKTYLMGS